MVCCPDLFWFSGTVDICFSKRRCHTDCKLFNCSTVTSHWMTLKMRKHKKRIIILKILSDIILLNLFSIRNRKLHIWSFFIHNVYLKIITPSVVFNRLPVLFCCISFTFISCITFYNCSAYMVDQWFPEIWTKKILISFFP